MNKIKAAVVFFGPSLFFGPLTYFCWNNTWIALLCLSYWVTLFLAGACYWLMVIWSLLEDA